MEHAPLVLSIDRDPEGGVTEVPVQTPRHRHHHGDNGKVSFEHDKINAVICEEFATNQRTH